MRLAWDWQLVQDTNNHHCEVLTPGTCCFCVPECPSLIHCTACLPDIICRKNVKLVAHYLPLFWHITFCPWECGHFEVTWSKWRKMDLFGCCSRPMLLTLKCAMSVPWSGANSHNIFPSLPYLSFACPYMSGRFTDWCQFLDCRYSPVQLSVLSASNNPDVFASVI